MSNSIKSLEHLDDILGEKDSEIQHLKNRIKEIEYEHDYRNWEWCKHREIPSDDFRKGLPIPRLEMIIEKLSDHKWRWHYGIVYKHYANMNKSGREILRFVPLGETTTSSDICLAPLNTPFRDGIHMLSDKIMFGLQAYITCPEEELIRWADDDLTTHQTETILKHKQ